jgi:hypothetical protein
MTRTHRVGLIAVTLLLAEMPNSGVCQTLIRPRAYSESAEAFRGNDASLSPAIAPSPSLFVGPAQSNLRTFVSPGALVVAPPEEGTMELLGDRPEQPFYPLRMHAVVGARAAVIADSTRLDDAAGDLFLPSAIPVDGGANFGTGWRSQVAGSGTSVGFSGFWETGNSAVVSGFRLSFAELTTDETRVTAPQAWVEWNRLLIGVAESVFQDVSTTPDTIDRAGPNGRPYLEDNTAQIRYILLAPEAYTVDPSGLYVVTAIENPQPGILAGTDESSFARFPDLVSSFRFQRGTWQRHPCANSDSDPPVYDEDYHLQLAAVVRDLGIENSAATVRETATGWGLHLSGRCALFPRNGQCRRIADYAFFSVCAGEGIGAYFVDLVKVSSTHDAAFDPVAQSLIPIPLTAYFVGYQHQWTDNWHTTIAASSIELESVDVVGATSSPYEQGRYASINLMWSNHECGAEKKLLSFFSGVEYSYGDRTNLDGASGDAHRVSFVLAATQ